MILKPEEVSPVKRMSEKRMSEKDESKEKRGG